MNLCDDKHQEIIYDGRNCPLCKAMNEIDTLNNELDELKDQLQEARRESES